MVAQPQLGVPPPAALDKRLVAALLAGQFGTSISSVSLVLVSFPLTAAVVTPASKEWTLGILTGVHALVSIAAAPVFGMLSDRCRSRFGMRRPFIMAGSLLTFLSMLVMGMSSSLSGLMAGNVLHSLGTSIFIGGFAAVVPDQVPASHRGRVLGGFAAMTILAGVVASLVLPGLMDRQLAMFAIPGVAGIVCSLILVVTLRDRRLADPAVSATLSMTGLLDRFRFDPRRAPDFSWAWSSHFLLTLGSAFTTTYMVFFLTDELNVAQGDLAGYVTANGLVGLATAVVGAGVGSYLSDRFQIRKRLITVSALGAAIGAFTIALAPTVGVYFGGMIIAGLATGMLMPVQGALIVDILPGSGEQSGRYMALAGLADSIPRSIGPMLAPVVIAIGGLTPFGGYPLVYLAGGAIAVTGGLLVRRVKSGR